MDLTTMLKDFWPPIAAVGFVFGTIIITGWRQFRVLDRRGLDNAEHIKTLKESYEACQARSIRQHSQTAHILEGIHNRIDDVRTAVAQQSAEIGKVVGTQNIMLKILTAERSVEE